MQDAGCWIQDAAINFKNFEIILQVSNIWNHGSSIWDPESFLILNEKCFWLR